MDYDSAIKAMNTGAKIARTSWNNDSVIFISDLLRCPLRTVCSDNSHAEPWFATIEDERALDWRVVVPMPEPAKPLEDDDSSSDDGDSINATQVVAVILVIGMILTLTTFFVDKHHPFIDHLKQDIIHLQQQIHPEKSND